MHELIQRLRPGTMDESTAWRLTIQSAMGLRHIHASNVLHRDIKSENIFLDARGNAKIGDLGVAKVMTAHADFARTLVGTPFYLSPELCENKPYNRKTDVWSLGVVLYEMMTGTHPFRGSSKGALFAKILKGRYPPVTAPFGCDLRNLLERCLDADPERRPDATDLLAAPASRKRAEALGIELPDDLPAWGGGGWGGGDCGGSRSRPAALPRRAIQSARGERGGGGERGGDAPSVAPPVPVSSALAFARAAGPRPATSGDAVRPPRAGERLGVPSPISARGSPRVPSNRGAGILAGIAAAAAGGGAAGAVARAAELALMRERVVVREEKERRNERPRDDRDEDDEQATRRRTGDSSMIVPRARPRDRPASARVSAIQNAATAARQRERVLVATRAAEAARAKLAAAEANVRVAELGVDARRDDDDGAASTPAARLSRQPGSDGRRSGDFPAPAKMAPASARKPTENRKPIAANRGSPAPSRLAGPPSRLARPASAGVPRPFTESVAAVAELPETPRGAFAFARGASRNDVEASIAESEASQRRAEAIRAGIKEQRRLASARASARRVAPASIEGAEAGVSTEVDVARSRSNAPPRRAPANGPGMIDFAPPRLSTARRTRVDVRSRPTVTRPSTAAPSVSRRTAETTRTAARPTTASGVSPRRTSAARFRSSREIAAADAAARERRALAAVVAELPDSPGAAREDIVQWGGVAAYVAPAAKRRAAEWRAAEATETGKKTAAGAEARNSAARVAAERASAAAAAARAYVLEAARRAEKEKAEEKEKAAEYQRAAAEDSVSARSPSSSSTMAPASSFGSTIRGASSTAPPEEIARAVARVAADVARNLQATNVEGDEDKNEGARDDAEDESAGDVDDEADVDDADLDDVDLDDVADSIASEREGLVPAIGTPAPRARVVGDIAFVFGKEEDVEDEPEHEETMNRSSPNRSSSESDDASPVADAFEDDASDVSDSSDSFGSSSDVETSLAVDAATEEVVRAAAESAAAEEEGEKEGKEEEEEEEEKEEEEEEKEEEEEEEEGVAASAEEEGVAASAEEEGPPSEPPSEPSDHSPKSRAASLAAAMHATERRAASLVGADVFARLYDLLATRAEAEEEGAHDDAEALGERVYAIVPREKAEAVTLAYRYMYLVGRLEALGAAEEEDERGAITPEARAVGKAAAAPVGTFGRGSENE